jgi:nucleoside triphosphatase
VVAIIKDGGKVLLTQSYKWHDKYSLPGGHVLDGETIISALKREVKEETGIEVSKADLVSVGELIRSPEYYDDLKHFILFVFSVEPSKREITLDVESHNFEWVDPKDLLFRDTVTEWTKVVVSHMKGPAVSVIEFEK